MHTAEDMERHEDPDLAAAYREENEAIRLDGETFGVAWLFALIPGALVLLLLSAVLGEWVWDALPMLFVGGMVALFLVKSGLIRRYRSELPIVLPGHGTFTGRAKRRLLAKAIAVVVLWVLLEPAGGLTLLREWLGG